MVAIHPLFAQWQWCQKLLYLVPGMRRMGLLLLTLRQWVWLLTVLLVLPLRQGVVLRCLLLGVQRWLTNNTSPDVYPSLEAAKGWMGLTCDCFISSLMGVFPGWFTCTPWSMVGDLRDSSRGVPDRGDPVIKSRTDAKTLELLTTVQCGVLLSIMASAVGRICGAVLLKTNNGVVRHQISNFTTNSGLSKSRKAALVLLTDKITLSAVWIEEFGSYLPPPSLTYEPIAIQ
uniref:Uncharacterized protein n=1 Tax=Timema bartmani TaxID=61472 RepID=A0A7R9ESJ8_9NEOP|nr:unnamed protein product [Timema bartmani]